jgi:hypothetical protein
MGVFGSKQEEATGGLLQITPLFVFITRYYPAKRIKKNNMGTACTGGGGLLEEHEWKRVLERTRRKWEYSVKINFKEICLESVDWIHLARDRDRWSRLF